MTEAKVRKIVREEVEQVITPKLIEQREEFSRYVGASMEEFSSQLKTAIEWMQGMYENHEKRLVYLENRIQ